MYTSGKRLIQLIAIVTLVGIITVIAFGYDSIVKYINPPPKTPSTPAPFKTIMHKSSKTKSGSPIPATIRKEVVNIIVKNDTIKKILEKKKFTIASVLPWMNSKGDLLGGCAVISFSNPIWVEFNASDPGGKPLEYIGWIKHLTVCVDLKSKRVIGLRPSLGTKDVPIKLPMSMSYRAKILTEKVLKVAKRFLAEKYGLKEDEINLTFYGILNNIAVVTAVPKTGDKLYRVEILMKIDTNTMEVIEAYKYIPHEIYINSKYINMSKER